MSRFALDGNSRAHLKATNEDGSSIVVYEQGAHLTSWTNSSGEEMLYVSPNAQYKDNVAIRGGTMVIFPQFALNGPSSDKNGFAALRPWAIQNVSSGVVVMTLEVKLDELQRSTYEAPEKSDCIVFFVYTIRFSNNQLTLNMDVSNKNNSTVAVLNFLFETYLAVSDLSSTLLNGLNLSPYIEYARLESSPNDYGPLRPPEVTNYVNSYFHRVYPNHPCAIIVQDTEKPYVLHVSGTPGSDMIVFNPGAQKSSFYPDLAADGYKKFVSIAHGNVLKVVEVSPSSSVQHTQTINVLYRKNESKDAIASSKL